MFIQNSIQMARLKSWGEEDKPREKLLMKGADSLSNSELIAILINNGTPEVNAVDMAKQLLTTIDNDIQRLSTLSVRDMVNFKIKGFGPVKATRIAAALELGIRRENLSVTKKPKITSSYDIAKYLLPHLQYKRKELFVVIYLNHANKIVSHEIISEGGITGTVADPRIIFKHALETNATGIALGHNHPSGSLKPSKADRNLTNKIKEAAAYFDIHVMDHVIVSDEGYYSFADNGLL